MKKVDTLLKGMLGEEGFLTLRKHIFRQDSQTTLTPIDMYLPMLAVPRTVLSWLVQNVHSVPLGEEKIIKDVPSLGNIDMHLKRTGNDSYSAEFIREGQILHSFDNQTLPMLGGQIIAFSGDYSGAIGGEAAKQVMSAVDDTSELRNLVRAMGKLIDYLVSEKIANAVPVIAAAPLADQLKEELAKKSYDPNTAKQGPSGFPLPNGPSGPAEAAKPAKKPQLKINQQAKQKQAFKQQDLAKGQAGDWKKEGYTLHHRVGDDNRSPGGMGVQQTWIQAKDKNGKVVGNLDIESHSSGHHAIGMSEIHPGHRRKGLASSMYQLAEQKLGAKLQPSHFQTEDAEALWNQPNRQFGKSEYFRGKLETLKKSNQYFVMEQNLYTKCRQCGIANFKKSEKGPVATPCACFEDSFTSGPFISNLAKSANGYTLHFSKDADEEAVDAFVLTLMNKVK